MDAGDNPMIVVDYTGEDTAVDMSSILTNLRQFAEYNYGKPVYQAVINTPAHFNDTQQKAIMIAAINVGFKAVETITEPNVAAIASLLKDTTLKKTTGGENNVLVFHVAGAGGDFHVSLITITKRRGKTFGAIARSIGRFLPALVTVTAVVAENLENLG